MPDHCSPDKEGNLFTCFSRRSLRKIAEAYNQNFPDKINTNQSRKKLWKEIEKKMLTKECPQEYCLLKNPVVESLNDNEINEQTFRPEMPLDWLQNKREWMSTIDIMKVMEQYQVKHKDFKFMGVVPIDFDHKILPQMCVSDEICNINVKKLYKKGYRRFGYVFNLDTHDKGGSHWVCMYTDLNTGANYYFDSYGHAPEREVVVLMNRIKKQGDSLIREDNNYALSIDNMHSEIIPFKKYNAKSILIGGYSEIKPYQKVLFTKGKNQIKKDTNIIKEKIGNKLVFKNELDCEGCDHVMIKTFRNFYNKNRFQYKYSECGTYCMHFIEQFLNGKKYNEIVSDIIPDDVILKERERYYRPPV